MTNGEGYTISPNPGRIQPDDPAFFNSRKPLAVDFIFRNQKITLIAVHLNSKSGDGRLFGRTQPPVLSSEKRRIRQSRIIAEFISKLLGLDKRAKVIVLGDFNDFHFSATLSQFTEQGLYNLAEELLAETELYTYVYEGNSQTLDHILVSDELFTRSNPQVDIVHRNAEYLYGIRESDHDPLLATFTFE